MMDNPKKENDENLADHNAAGNDASVTESKRSATSTSTKANGGTRSSPPRVGGSGRGEAKSIKADSASEAKRHQTSPEERVKGE